MDKRELRKAVLATRAELARACPDFARRIAQFAAQLPSGIVAGYWPVRDEADPRRLMMRMGRLLALPRIEGKTLSFRRWQRDDKLVDNHHGIAEPRDDAEPLTPHILLVPLLAFDATGHRLGYGGGYYDRALEALNVRAIGVAYAGQEVEAVPHEDHDRKLDCVVTENGVRSFAPVPSLERLTPRQKAIAYRALQVAAESPIYPDWEFQTLFGFTRLEVAALVAQWPDIDAADPGVSAAVTAALNNLAGYPHAWQKDWERHFDFTRDELVDALSAWLGRRPRNYFEAMT